MTDLPEIRVSAAVGPGRAGQPGAGGIKIEIHPKRERSSLGSYQLVLPRDAANELAVLIIEACREQDRLAAGWATVGVVQLREGLAS